MVRPGVEQGVAPLTAPDDPFLGLEVDSEATLAWERDRNEEADALLRSFAGFEELREAVAPHLALAAVTAPRRHGPSWFRLEGQTLVVAGTPTGEGRVLVDAGSATLDWFFPSPCGTRVAYGLSSGGDEQSVLHVVETAGGEVLDDTIPFASNATVAWLPDENGFALNPGTALDFERVDKVLRLHRLGQSDPSPPEPIDVREPYCVYPQVSDDGRYLVAVTSEVEPRADWIRELPDGDWRPFLLDVDGTCNGIFDGDHYVAVCTEGAPRGRLVRIPVATAADRATWEELLPEGELVLRFVQRAGGGLVVGALREAASVVLLLDGEGRMQELELPVRGHVSASGVSGIGQPAAANDGAGVAGDSDGFSFVLGAPDRSPGLYRFEGGAVSELRPPERTFPFTVTRLTTTAPDGATVGYEVVHRSDLKPSGLPVVVYAYGGWNVALVRGSLGGNAHLVEAGAALVLAHIRGGGEEGTAFHRDGALARKQHSYDDLYAVAADLAVRGIADPTRLAVLGGSNGGLMAAVALTQRPDLWCAVCSLVPVTDMLRYHLSPYGETGLREYGDPDDPADAEILRAYSPYHNVVRGRVYPPTLVVAGANDMRCPAWHARKLVARLQAEAAGGPFVLRVMGGGHLSTRRGADVVAEWQGFLLRTLGVCA